MKKKLMIVIPVVLLLVVHDVFNTFRAPSGASYLDGLPKFALAPMSPLVGVGFFGLAGAYGSSSNRWRCRVVVQSAVPSQEGRGLCAGLRQQG